MLASTSSMKALSTFSLSKRKRRRYARLENPEPKSSSAMAAPRLRRRASTSRGASSVSMMLSVISSAMRRGSTPERVKAPAIEGTMSSQRKCAADRLIEISRPEGNRRASAQTNIQHAAVDRDDEAALLRERDNLTGPDQLAAPISADQGFDGDDAAGRQVDLRLVVGLEFVELEGVQEIGLQRAPADEFAILGRVEER